MLRSVRWRERRKGLDVPGRCTGGGGVTRIRTLLIEIVVKTRTLFARCPLMCPRLSRAGSRCFSPQVRDEALIQPAYGKRPYEPVEDCTAQERQVAAISVQPANGLGERCSVALVQRTGFAKSPRVWNVQWIWRRKSENMAPRERKMVLRMRFQ